ncbi:MAG: ribonuclease [Pseudonocardiales bacterium]|nr:ribonuclease [Pseudonocardiales bacterium]
MTTPDYADQSGLAAALGIEIEAELLRRALTHRSYAYEHGGLPHNERLEFLGDAVLGLVVTETLYRAHPDLSEGKLAKLRASVVNMRALADVGRGVGAHGIGAFVRLGRGEETTGGRDKSSILADTVEAILGAIYLEHGLDGAARVVHALFDELMHEVATTSAGLDWKTTLQELTAERGLGVPEYQMSSAGPDHAKVFTARAQIAGRTFVACTGHSKKEAEQSAAESAWRAITAEDDAAPTSAAAAGSAPTTSTPGPAATVTGSVTAHLRA